MIPIKLSFIKIIVAYKTFPDVIIMPRMTDSQKKNAKRSKRRKQKARAKVEQEARAKEAKARAEQKSRAKAEQEARAKEAKARAEQQARAEQEAKSKAEQEARAKAEQEARAKAEKDAKARRIEMERQNQEERDDRKREALIALLLMSKFSRDEVKNYVEKNLVCPETYSEATEKMIDFFMGKIKLSRNQFQFIIECLYDIYDCKRVVELPADGYTSGGGVSALRNPTGKYYTHVRAGSWKPGSTETAKFRLLDHICK